MELHTIDRISKEVESKGDTLTISRGWSVSGPIHIGNLRPDGILPSVLGDVLREKGKTVNELVIVYDQDPFKAKDGQLIWFENPEYAERHIGVPAGYSPSKELKEELKGLRLRDVPDPFECHSSWADHWMDMVVSTLPEFGIKADIIRTSEFYGSEKTFRAFSLFMKRQEELREIINSYRNTPLPSEWVPFNGWCKKCRSISDTEILSVDMEKKKFGVRCRKCGWEGESSFSDGKMNWRVEWATLWYVYDIDIEPFGKDHATAGGSRESCMELAGKILGIQPPFGFWTEWVGIVRDGKDLGDMTSSGNILIRPDQWIEIAEPEVLRYLYIRHKFTSRILIDPHSIFRYVNEFDEAERIYYGEEPSEPLTEKDLDAIKRSYELSVRHPGKEKPLRVPYIQASIIAQVSVRELWIEKAVSVARSMGLGGEVDENIIRARVMKAGRWAEIYAPENFRIQIIEPDPDILDGMDEKIKASLRNTVELIIDAGDEKELDSMLFKMCRELNISPKKYFRAMYRIFLGKNSGPRLSAFIFGIGKDRAVEHLKKLLG